MRSIRGIARLAAGCLCITAGSAAADGFPTRPLRVIVGYQPGGAADLVARVAAEGLGAKLGQQVVVENRPGAGGLIANEMVAASSPDGYTLLLVNSSFAYLPTMYSKLKFDTVKDFAPVALLATTQNVLVVNANLPVKNVKELVALAKSRPGGLSYASGGPGGSTHLSTELFKSMTGTDILHIPYKGNAPSIADLSSGQVDMTIGPIPALLPFINGGANSKLRALATSGAQRTPMLPDLPTIAEAGVPGYDAGSWYGFMVAAKTPKDIRDKLEQALLAVGKSDKFVEQLKSAGAEPSVMPADEFRRFVASETGKWGTIIRETGIRGD
ncbi:tripartite tricarboxylate transporter substrate binding protein [Pigmentiphaga sp.]|uniref:Bug family tripartite tricarboxylate transporter substrate binding protein n=1 Tax=Pigmentiphaga sp. TaxID=1977564 RepID=UPI00128C8E9B|nr:tripartite tricarboxylate transporter substrate binding protein [Pigmentiphaga sp.]MPS28125.1 tripartite tricarboxylate transporter substrate binding protein [Alcaligenaceae bacterium SAGV5]MPS50751.1 tripartite tricarboxylate transporter substrate binding protein [Alcaligenaceae bacterium SAGV3]MPT57089.1 tripartite tricarboxylate transporter substrate binding protein [Alcaligenaceae bacterium]